MNFSFDPSLDLLDRDGEGKVYRFWVDCPHFFVAIFAALSLAFFRVVFFRVVFLDGVGRSNLLIVALF